MVRFKILVLGVFCAFCFGADLKSDIENLSSNPNADVSEILSRQSAFLDGRGNVNYSALCNELKRLGLFATTDSGSMELGFLSSQDNAILMIKAISASLESMGYKYFLTSFFENSPARWSVALSSRNLIDPGIMYNALLKQNIYIKKVLRGERGFIYEVDLSNASVKTDEILSTPIRPKSAYFIKLYGANLVINSSVNDNWHPFIRFFDKKLKLIATKEQNERTQNLSLALPSGAVYALIDDMTSLENIKHGLEIILE